MNDVRVHYYVDNTCAWQNLPLTLSGWHAADGNGDGNRKTIAIECIMSSAYNDKDKKSEDNCARLEAALLNKYNLDINHLYTHNHWYSRKYCPAYILPYWDKFKAKVHSYMNSDKHLYRVRKSWADAKSQLGAFSSLGNAKRACKAGYSVFDESGKVVYPVPKSYAKGTKIALKDITIYVSATAKSGTKKSGTFYLYDGIEVNGRYRVTTNAAFCGRTPIGKYVTGWVNKKDI